MFWLMLVRCLPTAVRLPSPLCRLVRNRCRARRRVLATPHSFAEAPRGYLLRFGSGVAVVSTATSPRRTTKPGNLQSWPI